MNSRHSRERKRGPDQSAVSALQALVQMPVQIEQQQRTLARLQRSMDHVCKSMRTLLARLPEAGSEPAASGHEAMIQCLREHGDPLRLLSRKPVIDDILNPLAHHIIELVFPIRDLLQTQANDPAACRAVLEHVESCLWNLLAMWGIERLEASVGAEFDGRTMQPVRPDPPIAGDGGYQVAQSLRPGLMLGERVILRQVVKLGAVQQNNGQRSVSGAEQAQRVDTKLPGGDLDPIGSFF